MDYARSEAKAAARERFRGLWAATTTPFDGGGQVDTLALGADMERLTGELGVDGVFCAGVMSEFWALSGSERRSLVTAVVAAARGRCPVIAHTGHHSVTETIELTRHAEAAGADFAVVINPYYPSADDDGLYEWFSWLCRSVSIGIWLFDTRYAGVSLSLPLIDRLADIDNICGIKVGRDHDRYLEVLRRVGDRILVCEPNEGTWLENMVEHGQRVFMSSAAPYLYQVPGWRPMREYTALALAGDTARAAEVAATLAPVRAAAARWLHADPARGRRSPVPYIKAWAGLLGMSGGPVRPPLTQVPPAELDALAADVREAGLHRLARAAS
ncbi:MAG: dihydrodipicolinate synthase family protein [Streptosporangiaceae bacterium]